MKIKSLLVCFFLSLLLAGSSCTPEKRPAIESGNGFLMVKILDEHEDPTPCIVRLENTKTGVDQPPDNCISLREQLYPDNNKLGQIKKRIPLKREKIFYCISEEGIRTQLKEGTWQLTVLHGNEYLPEVREIKIIKDQKMELTIRLERWINLPELGWYSGDDHVHVRIKDRKDAEKLLTMTRAEDVHLANILEMGWHSQDKSGTWFKQRGFGKKFHVTEKDYALIPGQEDPRNAETFKDDNTVHMGHIVVLNLKKDLIRDESKYFLYDYVFDTAHDEGALAGYGHLNFNGFEVHRDMSINIPKGKADFGEILQWNLNPSLYYEFLNLGFPLTASAGSDYPFGGSIGEVKVYAYIGKGEKFSSAKWFDAFKKGHTFVSNGLFIECKVNEAMAGDTLTFSENDTLEVTARVVGHPDFDCPRRLEIVQFGEVIKRVLSDDPNRAELHITMQVPLAYGSWIAARAYGWHEYEMPDSSKAKISAAHTNPIWILREGYRPWNHAKAEKLINKRKESLNQLRSEYNRLKQLHKEHPYLKQWNKLEKKIEEAEEIYNALMKKIELEDDLRQADQDK